MTRRRYMRVVFWIWGAFFAALALVAVGKEAWDLVMGWVG